MTLFTKINFKRYLQGIKNNDKIFLVHETYDDAHGTKKCESIHLIIMDESKFYG